MVSINRNRVRYNKYFLVTAVAVIFVIVIVISLEHFRVVIGWFVLYALLFLEHSLIVSRCQAINTEVNIYYWDDHKVSKQELIH